MNENINDTAGRRPLAVVTGASSGIGAAIAVHLAETFDLVIVARREKALKELADRIDGRAQVFTADITDSRSVHALAEHVQRSAGRFDVLVNCAGARPDRVLTSMPYDDALSLWEHQIQLNLTGAARVCFALVPLLRRPGGRIVNIGSIAAVTGGRRPGSAAYAAAKAGLHGLSLGLSRELAGDGITVNTVAPGFVADTEFTGSWGPEITAPLIAETPAGRAGTVHDVAETVAYLVSAKAAFITGQSIAVNGGMR